MKRIQSSLMSNKFSYWKSQLFKVSKILLIFIALSIINNAFLNPQVNAANKLTQQQSTITGVVNDPNGEPLPGVTVIVTGTTNGTITGIDGSYSISNVPSDATLTFTFIGMINQEVAVAGQTQINVSMEEETIGLDEVVAIGYGTTTRRNFTGAVSNVSVSDSPLSQIQTTSALDLLQGVTAGVELSQGGEAGNSANLLIRGQKSIGEGREEEIAEAANPLIVLDGVIFSGNIESINPAIIEDISLLKDASSLAAYGSQAANGVIMVTTKQGKIGKPIISLRSSATLITPNYRPDIRNGEEYIELMNARLNNSPGTDPTTWLAPIEAQNYTAGEETDWYDLIVEPGVTQNYSADISGGTENIRYLAGAMHNDQESFILGDNYQRTTFNARLDTKINQYISANVNFNQGFMETHGRRPSYGGAVDMSPWASPYLSDGKTIRKFPDQKETTTVNPLWDYSQGGDSKTLTKSTILGGSVDIKIPWVQGLSYKLTGTYTVNIENEKEFTHETDGIDINLGEDAYTAIEYKKYLTEANGSIKNEESRYYTYDNILTYTRDFGKHYVNATAVYTRSNRITDSSYLKGSDFSSLGNTILGVYGLANAGVKNFVGDNNDGIHYVEKSDVAYLGRVIYSYDDTYQLNASVRRDGSSVFGSDNKWGVFPAVGIAWTISNEDFFQTLDKVDYLKLKFSYGKNGNQSLRPYGTLSTIDMGRSGGELYLFDDESMYYGQKLAALGNAALAWETTKSFNTGFEADLFNSRIHFETDIYKSQTTDQIFSRTIPVMGAGITEQRSTMGQVDNWGIEVNASTVNINRADLRWSSGIVFSLNRNKLVEIDGSGEDFIDDNLFIGESLGAIYGYEWIGIVQDDDTEYMAANGAVPGDAMYANIDDSEDGVISTDDRKILGFDKENFRLAITNTITYKNWQLYFMLNGVFSGNDYGMDRNESAYTSYHGYAVRNELDHPFWTEENPSEKYPSIDYWDNTHFFALQKYTYIRLQDVNISYNLSSLVEDWGISSMSVYLAGKNLAFWAPDWEFSDPEVRAWNRAQLQRQITLGVNLSF